MGSSPAGCADIQIKGDAVDKITKADLGWMAAVIDMKGIVVTKKNRMRATPQYVLKIESKHFPVIRRLGQLTGTQPEASRERPIKDFMRRGCAEHCPEQHVHINEDAMMPPVGTWTITGAGAAIVLYNLLPYMTCDHMGYTEIMNRIFAQATLTGQGSGTTRAALFRLMNLGWKLPSNVTAVLLATPALTA